MKKFELGKVYEHISGGVVCAEFVPHFIGEDKAFGTWKSMHKVGDECETCVRHVCLEGMGLPKYREKPKPPRSVTFHMNIYLHDDSLTTGGQQKSIEACDKAKYSNCDRLGVISITVNDLGEVKAEFTKTNKE